MANWRRTSAPYVGAFTWATLPSAASYSGYLARVTDVGAPGLWVISDGTRWVPDGVQVLARSAAAVSCDGTTDENTLVTITIPAGLMGINGGLRVFTVWSFTNSGNNKTLREYFGGLGGTKYLDVAQTTVATVTQTMTITNRGAANSQVGNPNATSGVGGSAVAVTTSAINTASATALVLTGQKASAGETLTLDRYLVEVLP